MNMRYTGYLIFFLMFYASCDRVQNETKRYEDGSLAFEVPLVKGKREGELIKYYKDGTVEGRSHWRSGKLHGKSIIYHKNGKIKQTHELVHGVRCCTSEFYSQEGDLIERQYYNDYGELMDYHKFKDGVQIIDPKSKASLYFEKTDTVSLGEKFSIKMRIGNNRFSNIRAHIGDPNKNSTLWNPELPKSDSITIFYETLDYQLGKNTVQGLLVDTPANPEGMDKIIMDLVPFQFSFFVRDTTRLSMNESIKNTALR